MRIFRRLEVAGGAARPARQRRAAGLGAACVSAWVLLGPACQSRHDPPPLALSEQACTSACASFTHPGCGRAGLLPADQARCASACVSTARALPAACHEPFRAYLACVGRARIDCARATCSAAVCVEQGEGVLGCEGELAHYRECAEPCAFAGMSHVAERRVSGKRVQSELVRAGCAECPKKLGRAAPAGAPCQAASVCSQHCCACPSGPARYLARACVDGTCADPSAACQVALEPGPVNPCR
ncbi:MAG TPA: hypothetical protein VKZ49_11245 [Polyangiaceae bacterium]|nr:hypothetical protein [Polyangiaceae bacterium]